MEAENTETVALDLWDRVLPGDSRYVDGATNNEHIEFTGNEIGSGPPKSHLVHTFHIEKPDTYQLFRGARKRLEGARYHTIPVTALHGTPFSWDSRSAAVDKDILIAEEM